MLTIPHSGRRRHDLGRRDPDLGVGLETEACKMFCAARGESVYAMNCLYRAARRKTQTPPLFDFSPLVKF